ncbi:MAG: magnesium/cobalt transporter CorA [Candidatus Nitrosopumilus sp. bin_32a]
MRLPLFRKSSKKPGDSPGTIVYVGDVTNEKIELELINYDVASFSEEEILINDIHTIEEKSGIKWLNVTGIHDTNLVCEIGTKFDIHKLVLEDIVNTARHAKIEEYCDSLYAILKMFYVDANDEIRMEHINLILKKDFVISFQESKGDVFEPIRKRIRDGKKKIHESGSDYLFYALIDAIIDNYFVILRKIGERIDLLKKSIAFNVDKENLLVLDILQNDVLVLQNSIIPLESLLNEIEDGDSQLIHESNLIYFRNLHDHISQILSSLSAVKDKLSSMNDYYISAVSNKTNEIMKTLALVATICVPITVIAGIYGMNFQYMPELSSPIAYPMVLGSMAGVGLTLYGYFRRKKWV